LFSLTPTTSSRGSILLSPTGELVVWDFSQNLRVRVERIATMADIEKARGAEPLGDDQSGASNDFDVESSMKVEEK
jgi:hypothetical protein